MFDKYFILKPGEKNVRAKTALAPSIKKEEIFYKKINQAQINLAIPVANAELKEKWALDLFASMLGRGMSSPLFEEIRDKRGLCYAVSASYFWGADYGLFRIYMGTDKEKYREAIDLALDILGKNKNNKVLLGKAKKMEFGELARRFENPLSIITRAAHDAAYFGKPYGLEDVERAIKDITIQDIEKVVEKYLKPDQFKTVILAPEDFKE